MKEKVSDYIIQVTSVLWRAIIDSLSSEENQRIRFIPFIKYVYLKYHIYPFNKRSLTTFIIRGPT